MLLLPFATMMICPTPVDTPFLYGAGLASCTCVPGLHTCGPPNIPPGPPPPAQLAKASEHSTVRMSGANLFIHQSISPLSYARLGKAFLGTRSEGADERLVSRSAFELSAPDSEVVAAGFGVAYMDVIHI